LRLSNVINPHQQNISAQTNKNRSELGSDSQTVGIPNFSY